MTTQPTLVTKNELAILLGCSPTNIDHWRKKGLLTQPERRGQLVFNLDIVREDVKKNHLKVSTTFIESTS
jgi:hypothetical protein